jgi:hypothetical protein
MPVLPKYGFEKFNYQVSALLSQGKKRRYFQQSPTISSSKKICDIHFISQYRRANPRLWIRPFISSKPQFSGLRFDTRFKIAIGCIYPFHICNFDIFHVFLNVDLNPCCVEKLIEIRCIAKFDIREPRLIRGILCGKSIKPNRYWLQEVPATWLPG